MLKDLTLGQKIAAGFVILNVILATVGVMTYISLSEARNSFTKYREMTRDVGLVFDLEFELLKARMDMKDYLIGQTDKAYRKFEGSHEALMESLAKANQEITDPQRVSRISDVMTKMETYDETFAEVFALHREKKSEIEKATHSLKVIHGVGEKMENSPDVATRSEAIAAVAQLVARVMAAEGAYYNYLLNNQPEDAAKAISTIEASLPLVDSVEAVVDAKWFGDLSTIRGEMEGFKQSVAAIRSSAQRSNDMIRSTLEVIGPEAGESILWVADDIKQQQAVIEPEVRNAIDTTILEIVVASVVAIGLGLFIGWAITRGAVNSVTRTANLLTQTSRQISSSASSLKTTSARLAASSADQSSSLQETSVSIDELTAMVKANTENANRSLDVAEQSKTAAEQGSALMQNMLDSMAVISESNDSIKSHTQKSNEQISEIVNVINDIAQKTQVINDIVFQTKLLSFNASVEAARAGEHGKGFAVVAEEVGHLAQKSGVAAGEISALLTESTKKVSQIVEESKRSIERLVEESHARVAEGNKVAANCGKTLGEILDYAGRVNSMLSEIASASNEQSTGISQINIAVGQLDRITQENSQSADGLSVAGSEIDNQTKKLGTAVEELRRLVSRSPSDATTETNPQEFLVGDSRSSDYGQVLNLPSAKPARDTTPVSKAVSTSPSSQPSPNNIYDDAPSGDHPDFDEGRVANS